MQKNNTKETKTKSKETKTKKSALVVSDSEIDAIRKQLEENGLTAADNPLAELYVQHWRQWRQATIEIEANGMMILSPNNFLMPSPWLTIQKNQAEILKKLTTELGLSPLSRKRAGVEKALPDNDSDLL